ncbi:signal peptidase I [Neomicrococcus aestuarii]|nr:signal peptidase I [Neomicrococcus aestuarii]
MADETPHESSTVKTPETEKKKDSWTSVLLSTALNLIIAIAVVALVQAFFVKVYQVPSGSMETTLNVGDRIVVNRTAYNGAEPPTGDIIVFRADENWSEELPEGSTSFLGSLAKGFGDITGIGPSNEKYLVKRVIAQGGDTVECCTSEGTLTVNGEAINEDYIYEDLPFVPGSLDCSTDPQSYRCFGPITVPEGQVLVMGDHRSASSDSVINCRYEGVAADDSCARFVKKEDVIGRVFFKLWPVTDWRGF